MDRSSSAAAAAAAAAAVAAATATAAGTTGSAAAGWSTSGKLPSGGGLNPTVGARLKVEEVGDAIAALTLEEARSLIEHLHDRLGVFAAPFVPGAQGQPAVHPHGQGRPVVLPHGQGNQAVLPHSQGNLHVGAGQIEPPVPAAQAEPPRNVELNDEILHGWEQNCRKPELSELKEVKQLVQLAVFVMEESADDIRNVVEKLEKMLVEVTAVGLQSVADELLIISRYLQTKANHTRHALDILRECRGSSVLDDYSPSSSSGDTISS